MHEYSLADQLVKTLLEQVEEVHLRKSSEIHVRLGELRMISKEALNQAYSIIVEDTYLEGSRLEYKDIPVTVSCSECGFRGPVDYEDDRAFHFSAPILNCPKCGSSVEIVGGREFEIRKITVEND